MKPSRRATLEFNLLAPLYDRVTRFFNWRAAEVLHEKISAAAPAPATVLDIGTGTGALATLFKNNTAPSGTTPKIAGLDLSLPMLKESRKKSSADLMALHDASEGHIPFLDEKFDVTAASGVFDFIGTAENLCAEMARVTKPGGIVAITHLPAENGAGHRIKPGINPLHEYAPDHIEEIFARAGVEKISSETVTAYKHLWPVKYGLYIGRKKTPEI